MVAAVEAPFPGVLRGLSEQGLANGVCGWASHCHGEQDGDNVTNITRLSLQDP